MRRWLVAIENQAKTIGAFRMIGLCGDFVKLTRMLRESGPRRAVGIALLAIRARLMRRLDVAWEKSLGLSFDESHISLESLHIDSPNKQHGFSYVPCTGVAVRTLLDSINSNFRGFCFIDFGSGEGRSLIIAATYPFDEIIGVEFANELHQVAGRNIAKASSVIPAITTVRSICLDAAQFNIPRKDCVLYFYNPFGEAVFKTVLRNIERVHRECGAKFYIVFHQTRADLETDNTKNAELLCAARFLKPFSIRFNSSWTRFLLGSQDLYIFETVETTDDASTNERNPAERLEIILGLPAGATVDLSGTAAMVSSP
jgi:predicted RNA methylase